MLREGGLGDAGSCCERVTRRRHVGWLCQLTPSSYAAVQHVMASRPLCLHGTGPCGPMLLGSVAAAAAQVVSYTCLDRHVNVGRPSHMQVWFGGFSERSGFGMLSLQQRTVAHPVCAAGLWVPGLWHSSQPLCCQPGDARCLFEQIMMIIPSTMFWCLLRRMQAMVASGQAWHGYLKLCSAFERTTLMSPWHAPGAALRVCSCCAPQ